MRDMMIFGVRSLSIRDKRSLDIISKPVVEPLVPSKVVIFAPASHNLFAVAILSLIEGTIGI